MTALTRLARIALIAGLVGACARTPRPTTDASASGVVAHRVYDASAGRFATLDALAAAMGTADVVFVGEQHDDPATHRMELALLEAAGRTGRPVVLSLEMFERDAQPVLDDYLAGRVAESELLARGRPWPRYATDYRALVELAKGRGWPVVAANVPRSLASLVSRAGLRALDTLAAPQRAMAAAELRCQRDAYFDRFAKEMEGHGGPGTAATDTGRAAMTWRFYEAQCVKDETMAESIVRAAGATGGAIVVHYDGAFHSDYGQGTVERVRRRSPGARLAVVSVIPVASLGAAAPAPVQRRGDWLIFVPRPAAADSSKPR
jgi:uncharacterized iron-regulated protein